MIISKDISPERDCYYIGSQVIELLSSDKNELFEIFEKINTETKISLNLYFLALDWLFILGVVNVSDDGNVTKCF